MYTYTRFKQNFVHGCNEVTTLSIFQIFLYYDVSLPSMTISSLNPVKDFELDEMQVLEKLLGECSINEKQQKMQQLTEWLLYGVH